MACQLPHSEGVLGLGLTTDACAARPQDPLAIVLERARLLRFNGDPNAWPHWRSRVSPVRRIAARLDCLQQVRDLGTTCDVDQAFGFGSCD